VVRLYHGDDAAQEAEAAFDRVFKDRKAPQEIPTAVIPASAIDGEVAYLPRILVEVGLASSGSEARRLIEGRGVRVNGEPATSEEVPAADLRGAVLQVGKRRFVRLID
jgi:tyrosyl-tRNA synthetase